MKRLLLVVDYQKDFVDGALGFPGAEALDGPIAAKIAACRAAGDDVAFTLDYYQEHPPVSNSLGVGDGYLVDHYTVVDEQTITITVKDGLFAVFFIQSGKRLIQQNTLRSRLHGPYQRHSPFHASR